jgi:anti-sigma factor RsiW
MKCESCNSCLSAYLDGKLNERQSKEMQEHISSCRRCREDLKELTQLRSVLRALPTPSPREGFWDDTLRTVRLSDTGGKRRKRLHLRYSFSYMHAVGVAATLALVAVLMSLPHSAEKLPTPALAPAAHQEYINPVSLVSLHTREVARSPFVEMGKLRFAGSEAEAEDIADNGKIDVQ